MSPGRVPDGQWPGAPAPELSLPVTRAPKAGGWTPGPTASLTHTPEKPGPPAQSLGPSIQELLTEHPLHTRPVRNSRRQRKLCAPCSGGSFHRENESVKKKMYRGNTREDFQKVEVGEAGRNQKGYCTEEKTAETGWRWGEGRTRRMC